MYKRQLVNKMSSMVRAPGKQTASDGWDTLPIQQICIKCALCAKALLWALEIQWHKTDCIRVSLELRFECR